MERPHVLLVEGRDDFGIVTNLLKAHAIDWVHVKEKSGWVNLHDSLKVELLASGLISLGVVVDADTSPDSRWQSLRDLVPGRLPEDPDPRGTIVHDGEPRLGIWLMPDNRRQGIAEKFAASLVPAGDTLWPRAEDAVRSIPPDEQRFKPASQLKP